MVLKQTLPLTKSIPFLTFNCLLTDASVPSLCSNPPASVRLLSFPTRRLGFSGRLKCSMVYSSSYGHYDQDQSGGPQYPRPSEIQWKKELCNSVQLIGIIATPVQIKHLNSGKILAWSRLAIKKSATDTAWINLTFWDELAHSAFQHVEKGNQVYISGRLVSDTVESDDGKQQTYYKVVVQQLNFVERTFPSVALYDRDSASTTPGRKVSSYPANTTGSTVELWQAYFANPSEWWDNRINKRNPKYPDFKHKDTGEALWIEGRNNPTWVKSQLAILDSGMESNRDQNAGMRETFLSGDDYTSF